WDGGSAGSQTTFNNGRAVVEAAREVRRQLLEVAAELLEAATEDLILADGRVEVAGTPDRGVAIAEVARRAQGGRLLLASGSGSPPPQPAYDAGSCTGGMGLESYNSPTYFCHAARVRVDPDTGVARVLEVVAAHDSGAILNPPGAEGQVEGGVVQAIGQALTEGTQYGADGHQRNPGLLDYKLQTSADAPAIRTVFVAGPAPNGGPYGCKGIGEPPVVPTAAAVGNAIARATGARVRELPMTAERVWAAVQDATL